MTNNKVRILFLASNPLQTQPIKLAEEYRSILNTIRKSEYRDQIELFSFWAVHDTDLQDILLNYKPTIVHFSGHGTPNGEIILLDDTSQPTIVSADALKSLFFVLNSSVRLVLLNTCYSSMQASAISDVIDFVVGVNTSLDDESAISFAAAFYNAIGCGRSLQDAVDFGKAAIEIGNGTLTDTPQVFEKKGSNPTKEHYTGPNSVLAFSNSHAGKLMELSYKYTDLIAEAEAHGIVSCNPQKLLYLQEDFIGNYEGRSFEREEKQGKFKRLKGSGHIEQFVFFQKGQSILVEGKSRNLLSKEIESSWSGSLWNIENDGTLVFGVALFHSGHEYGHLTVTIIGHEIKGQYHSCALNNERKYYYNAKKVVSFRNL